MNGYCGSSTNASYKFQLIIDGCNGPIRFREDRLRRACATAPMAEGSTRESDGSGAERVSSRNHNHGDDADNGNDNDNDDETILSLLRPESIVVGKQKEQLRNSARSKKNAKGRRRKNHRPRAWTVEDGSCVEESSNRLDVIPLLEKLLLSSTRNDRDSTPNGRQLFDSISVVFDGISITKRPPVPSSNKQPSQLQQQQESEEEIVRGRLWHVMSDTANATSATAVIASKATLCEELHNIKSGCLTIEVTGLYDEADNVIVERIIEHHRRKIDCESLLEQYQMSCSSDQAIDAAGEGRGPMATAATRIRILRRTERGAGKNRRLFQPLGLLRPESVACIFEFGVPVVVSTTSNDCKEAQEEFQSSEHSDGNIQSSFDSSSFRRLAIDGDQTLRSVRRQNPGNVFLTLNESQEVPHATTGSEKGVPVILPIVATDDVFLRQRIVHEGGYVSVSIGA